MGYVDISTYFVRSSNGSIIVSVDIYIKYKTDIQLQRPKYAISVACAKQGDCRGKRDYRSILRDKIGKAGRSFLAPTYPFLRQWEDVVALTRPHIVSVYEST